MKHKNLILAFFICVSYFLLFWTVHFSFQNSKVYYRFAPTVINYDNCNKLIYPDTVPFRPIAAKALEGNWDARHYYRIKKTLYKIDEVGQDYIFGFFPLFSLCWKFSHLSSTGIIVLNFLFLSISLCILSFIYAKEKLLKSIVLVFTLPIFTVYFMPYTEAVFALTFSVAILGVFLKNRNLFFIGLFLFAMSRPSIIIVLLTLLCLEFILFLKDRNIRESLKRFLWHITPIVLGTLSVSAIQLYFNSGAVFKFVEVQKYWGTKFQIPNVIFDWSFEGFGMNIWAMFFVYVFGIPELFRLCFIAKKEEVAEMNYWYFFSWIYLIGITTFVLLFQGGNLHSLFRYTLCTPFFFIVFFNFFNQARLISFYKIALFFIIQFICSYLFMRNQAFSPQLDFAKTGYFVLVSAAFIIIKFRGLDFKIDNKYGKVFSYSFYGIILLLSIFWNTYLLNMFITNAWICL